MNKPLTIWPAAMRLSVAALYCDLSEAAFQREVAAGRLPDPITLGKSPRWRRTELDEALAVLGGDDLGDWRDGSPLYGKAANG